MGCLIKEFGKQVKGSINHPKQGALVHAHIALVPKALVNQSCESQDVDCNTYMSQRWATRV